MRLTLELTDAQRAQLAPAFAEIERQYGTLGLHPGAILAQVHADVMLVWTLDHEHAMAVDQALRGRQ